MRGEPTIASEADIQDMYRNKKETTIYCIVLQPIEHILRQSYIPIFCGKFLFWVSLVEFICSSEACPSPFPPLILLGCQSLGLVARQAPERRRLQ